MPVYVNVNEMAFGRRQWFTLCEQSDFITHTGVSQPCHANASLYGLRKRQWRKIIALGFDHQTNGRAMVNIEDALFDQVDVDRRVKPTVIDHIVDMSVSVVVHPACANGLKNLETGTRFGLGAGAMA